MPLAPDKQRAYQREWVNRQIGRRAIGEPSAPTTATGRIQRDAVESAAEELRATPAAEALS